MEVFLIDSWIQNKADEVIKFIRHAEQGNLFHFSGFSRQSVALSGNCFTWLIFPETLTGDANTID